jgi:hypothetical protein
MHLVPPCLVLPSTKTTLSVYMSKASELLEFYEDLIHAVPGPVWKTLNKKLVIK